MDASTLAGTFPNYTGQLADVFVQKAREARTVPASDVLEPPLADRLPHDLYSHQAESLDHLADGEDVCVTTSTASGKTLVYALQMARAHLADPNATGLLVCPTKALSRDQERALNDLYDTLDLDLTVRVYDGDTTSAAKRDVRRTADVVVTNFSGLNAYLPQHSQWARLFGNCSVLAIDEAHTYSGVHGMHVAWVLRRLRRVLAHYDADPRLVFTSATIGNPAEHCENLAGADVWVVSEDGSPRGRREIAFWRPPADTDGGQRPADAEAADLLAHLGTDGVQSLLFVRSRKQTELNRERAKRAATRFNRGRLRVESYNAGHTKRDRRGVENRLKSGDLDGVVTTSALELGIDVGSVGATLLTGYPGTRQSFWQQLGRSGRGTSDALSILVGRNDAIDNYVFRNPDYVLGDHVEDAVVDRSNNTVYSRHILCAADELPLTYDDARYFGRERLRQAVEMWKRAGYLTGTLDTGVIYDRRTRPQSEVSMYATGDTEFDLRTPDDCEAAFEPVGRARAYREFHPGATYLQKGQQFEVVGFDESGHHPRIDLEPVDVDYYTQTNHTTRIGDLEPEETVSLREYRLNWGMGTVTVHYDTYVRKSVATGEQVGVARETGLPPLELRTQAMWLEVPQSERERIGRAYAGDTEGHPDLAFQGAQHAAEHGMIKLAPLEFMLDKSNLGGISVLDHPELGLSGCGIFVYDGVEGGLGFSRRLFDAFATVATNTRGVIAGCSCEGHEGCPGCVMDSQCGSGNTPLHTGGAVDLLGAVLPDDGGSNEDADSPSPEGEEGDAPDDEEAGGEAA
ncbi:DEAD/DEAH box helicase [Halomarina litorea]|uniref:DEAD/DEAH box helicase n=1 Tax=Halomarina litorea TaxID=2961595 RepID=UPI0020C3BC98|nr:DEAD/DEAH box helicase [Halomarina sp. BCD28]